MIISNRNNPKIMVVNPNESHPKKGPKNNPYNYRRIALIVSICKIFTQILHSRLESWIEEAGIRNEFQMGFRRKRGTYHNIFSPMGIILLHFRRAFSSVKHSILLNTLFQSGISARLIRILIKLYSQANMPIKINNQLLNTINVTESVLQGEILSPLLFSLFINDIDKYFRQKKLNWT